jgi:HK97 gp10 family phage protein
MSINIKIQSKTKIIDKGANNIFKQTEALDGKIITSGIHLPEGARVPTFKGKAYSQTPIAQYAHYNEYGTRNTPSRPFMRSTMDKRLGQFLRESVTDMRRLPRGGNAESIIKTNSDKIARWIKATIWTLRYPLNADSTLKKKKKLGAGSNPLIFSGAMRNSITSKVMSPNTVNARKLRRIVNKINKEILGLTK